MVTGPGIEDKLYTLFGCAHHFHPQNLEFL
jgi:hypothetical protein